MLANLITFELIALFQPEIFKIDPWMVFLQKGGGLFTTFVLPDGRGTTDYRTVRTIIFDEE